MKAYLRLTVATTMLFGGSASAQTVDDFMRQLSSGGDNNSSLSALSKAANSDTQLIDQVLARLGEVRDSNKPLLAQAIVNGGPSAIKRMPPLLASDEPSARRFAAQVLTLAGEQDDATVASLSELMARDPDEAVRGAAAEAIRASKASGTAVVDALVKSLDDESQWVRCVAVESLGNLGSPAAAHLSKIEDMAANDPDSYVREQAQLSASQIKSSGTTATSEDTQLAEIKRHRAEIRAGQLDESRVEFLGTIYLSSASMPVSTLQQLGKIAPGFETAHRPQPKQAMILRGQSMEAFRDMGPEAVKALPYLVVALSDDAPWIRAVAAETIGNIGKQAAAAIPQVSSLLDDQDAYVKQTAEAALKKLTDQ